MVTKVLTNYARVLMFLEDLVSLPEDCGQNSASSSQSSPLRPILPRLKAHLLFSSLSRVACNFGM